jgi:amino acid transporter/antitoxin (DNA-binding transcriptional repressor) of toxin-antitoxin stability system
MPQPVGILHFAYRDETVGPSAASMSDDSQAAVPEAPPPGQGGVGFGTFGGVFTPSILTILGVVMYLLLPKVTGQGGLAMTLIIVVVAHIISLATGLSVASIATNRTVGAGGAYFMISRSLGAPAGAAIGIPLFFAQALSVTFYIVGFTQALMPLLPAGSEWMAPWISTGVNILLTAISLKSADLAIKAQYVVMAAIAVSLVSFFGGTSEEYPHAVEWWNPEGPGFAEIFAVFFPAVTGIMAGVSMSGDLKEPKKAIPAGTLWAILVGFLVYMAFPIWLAVNYGNDRLINDTEAVWGIARWSPLIYAGVFGATLSSALGSILTAPRTLQALGMDQLAPKLFAKGHGAANEPRNGTLLTFALAQAGIFLGSLDAIAPVLTMFFLATYGFTNLACGLQKWSGNPSFRPTFSVSWLISLGGAGACFYVMSIINLGAMVAAVVFSGLFWFITERRDLETTYGDARHGIWSAIVRYALQKLRRVQWHPMNWRPNLVIFGGDPDKRPHLLRLGDAIVQDRGIVTYFHLLTGAVAEHSESRKELYETFDPLMQSQFPNVFYRVEIVPDVFSGATQIAQSYGVGSFEANTVMAGWPNKQDRLAGYMAMCRDLAHLDRSLLLVRNNESQALSDAKSIHVWWGGLEGNGGLMLLLAFLLKADRQWRSADVKVMTVVNEESSVEEARANLLGLLEGARLEAEPVVILRDGRSIADIMAEKSGKASLAILGFRLPDEGMEQVFHERMTGMLERLPTTLLVHSARSFEGEPVLFDEVERQTLSDASDEVGLGRDDTV